MKNRQQRERSNYDVIRIIRPLSPFNSSTKFLAHVDKHDGSWEAYGSSKTSAKKTSTFSTLQKQSRMKHISLNWRNISALVLLIICLVFLFPIGLKIINLLQSIHIWHV